MASPEISPSPDRPVVTRFAPSPTGNLHIGGARTALYAWVVAQQAKRRVGPFKDHTGGGRFILRFEDTDRARSSTASEKQIAESMLWLGLDWDEGPAIEGVAGHETTTGDHGPYRQSERLPLYHEQLDRLRAAGHVYDDDGAVRFKVTQDVTFVDAVYGTVTVKADDIEDFVIMKRKADGDDLAYPTFHFAVVVDDALMEVTHVIRGVEHLSNTPKHAALYDALGFGRPLWCHTPSIMNPDGSKMSKRDKAKAARKAADQFGWPSCSNVTADDFQPRYAAFKAKESDDAEIASWTLAALGQPIPEIETLDFKQSGYLAKPLLNYLSLLGWNPGNDLERFDLEILIETFDLSRVNKANARFDRDKLLDFNRDAITQLTIPELAAAIDNYDEHDGYRRHLPADKLNWLAEAFHERARTLREIADEAEEYIFDAPARVQDADYESKGAKKWLTKSDDQGLSDLAKAYETLAALDDDFTPDAIETALNTCVQENDMKNLGSVAQPLRMAIRGTPVTPPIHLVLTLIGKGATLRRIDACWQAFKGKGVAEASG
ncbi:MAG: glutamate--tRNA ligase family protein [Planctomycetota bacterium]